MAPSMYAMHADIARTSCHHLNRRGYPVHNAIIRWRGTAEVDMVEAEGTGPYATLLHELESQLYALYNAHVVDLTAKASSPSIATTIFAELHCDVASVENWGIHATYAQQRKEDVCGRTNVSGRENCGTLLLLRTKGAAGMWRK